MSTLAAMVTVHNEEMPSPRRPTSTDVARLSGVSQPVVSYVLNNTPGRTVAQATRERVLSAAAELGYTPSRAAQNLVRGRSSVVVLDAPPGPDTTVAPAFFAALSDRLDSLGFSLISHFAPQDLRAEHLDRLVTATQADAVLAGHPDDGRYAVLRQRGVVIHPLLAGQDVANIVLPVQQQLEHLTELGHRNIAFIGPQTIEERAAVAARRAAAEVWLADRRLPAPIHLSWSGDLDVLVANLGSAVASGVTAVAAHNDAVAMPVLSAAHILSLGVPSSLAVIGVDGTPLARVMTPALSTVRWTFDIATLDYLARRVAGALQGALPETQPSVSVVATVVRRRST